MFEVFDEYESQVRSYCRKYETIFSKAKNAELYARDGKRYIDFLAVAGSMNFGHNNAFIKEAILQYLAEDNIMNALDMYTEEKEQFLSVFQEEILKPRELDYKVMCCGPTGTNAVEAALKLARKNTGRSNVFAFSGAFHGMSLGALALTTDRTSRNGAGVPLNNVTFIPYDGAFDSLAYMELILEDDHSGFEKPAAIILETVQAEGGINVASIAWLRGIRRICDENDILMIVDDIQVGIGRTGSFFSFERAGIQPDMVILSKSISGFGIPMALLLIRPQYDIFAPAEHNGTFRGNQLSFVGATAGMKYYVAHHMDEMVEKKSAYIRKFITEQILPLDARLSMRGIGMIYGIDFSGISNALAMQVIHKAFDKGLVIEVAGRHDSVVKILPPLTIEENILQEGLEILKEAIKEVL